MPEKKTSASAANEYIVCNRMTHWQKTYPHWVSVASIIILLLFWEAICRCGLVSSLFLPAPSQIISALLGEFYQRVAVADTGSNFFNLSHC